MCVCVHACVRVHVRVYGSGERAWGLKRARQLLLHSSAPAPDRFFLKFIWEQLCCSGDYLVLELPGRWMVFCFGTKFLIIGYSES